MEQITIYSFDASRLHEQNLDYEAWLEWQRGYEQDKEDFKNNLISESEIRKPKSLYRKKAALTPSLFLKYARKHGLTVLRGNRTRDIISIRFHYPYGDKRRYDIAREEFYKNGVLVWWNDNDDPIRYRRLFRSPGLAKEGTVLFVKENLQANFEKFLTMGLASSLKDADSVRLTELEAYKSLVAGTAKDFYELDPRRILIVDDLKSTALKDIASVGIENEHCDVVFELGEVTNTLHDGMGLLDASIFPDSAHEFAYLRQGFFKCNFLKASIQQFFVDYCADNGMNYDTASVTDVFGHRMLLKDIDAICTVSSIKWYKFLEYMGTDPLGYWIDYVNKCDNQFAIIKTGSSSKYGDMQRASYQMINTLDASQKELENICRTSIDYINGIKSDNAKFLEYAEITKAPYKVNEAMLALCQRNEHFMDTGVFRDWKNRMVSKLTNDVTDGKLFVPGDYLTLFGNPIALLYQAVGDSDPIERDHSFSDEVDAVQCYTRRFPDGAYLAGFRNPHNSENNIIYLRNVISDEIAKYLPDVGRDILILNNVRTDVQDRLSGADYDTDTALVTDQADIVRIARDSYKDYPTIVNNIPMLRDNAYRYSEKHLALMDQLICDANLAVGSSSNIAQIGLSWYHDLYYKYGHRDQQLKKLVIIGSVLAQIAIDNAKRSFAIDISKETRHLSKVLNTYCDGDIPRDTDGNKKDLPLFYANVQKHKTKSKSQKESYDSRGRKFMCPMDLIYDIIKSNIVDGRAGRTRTLSILEINDLILAPLTETKARNWRRQVNAIKTIITEHQQQKMSLGIGLEADPERMTELCEDTLAKIKKLSLKQRTIYELVKRAMRGELSDISRDIFIFLYRNDASREMFLECFQQREVCTKDRKTA